MHLNTLSRNLFSAALILTIGIFTLSVGCNTNHTPAIVIKGGTLIDVTGLGTNGKDLANTYIIIRDDTVSETGQLSDNITFPKNAQIIDASGKYIIPGLIDGFAVLNNQAYANAFLYMGITSIIGVDGGRRGPFFQHASPGPDVYRLESVGDEKKSVEEHIADLESLYEEGYSIALLKYALTPDQVIVLKARALELGMGCIGEFGYTTYKEGAKAGIEVFVHTTRYSLDVAPDEMAKAVADEPFSDDMESAKWKYYRYLANVSTTDTGLINHAKMLANSGTFLMPTLSLLYLDIPGSKNPWDFPVSAIISDADINNPADRETGKHDYKPDIQENYTNLAIHEFEIERTYASHGAEYLAGSATDVWGTMPGISLHTELSLLSDIGLPNRKVLAAATSNFSKAFGWKTGIIKSGFSASLLVLNSNPIEDLANLLDIDTMILNGKIIDRTSLLKP